MLLLSKWYVKDPLKPLSSVFSEKAWKHYKHLEFELSLHLSIYRKPTTNSSHTDTYICKNSCKIHRHTVHLQVTTVLSPCSLGVHYFRDKTLLWTRDSYIELQITSDCIKISAKLILYLCSATGFIVTLDKTAFLFSHRKGPLQRYKKDGLYQRVI